MNRLPKTLRVTSLFGVAVLLAACAGIPPRSLGAAERARVATYAGPSLRHFTWYGNFDGWQAVDAHQALIWTTPAKAYLVQVAKSCADLREAHRIGLTSTLDAVYSRYDYVTVHGARCAIEQIRPVDFGRLQADLHRERDMRQANGATTPAASRSAPDEPLSGS
ncbi:MAG TPA: DUF6491 family protein [Steroidobacteraceae bacterium]|nr:DUF6491 family protein [Steroidobacteraceae bacterium]